MSKGSPKKTRPLGCYVLQLWVADGGVERDELHAYPTLAQVRECLEKELFSEEPRDRWWAAYLAAYEEELLWLWPVVSPEVAKPLDLRVFINVRADGGDWASLADKKQMAALGQRMEEHEFDPDSFDVEFKVDWKGLNDAVPVLSPPLLKKGGRVRVRLGDAEKATEIDYGLTRRA
jgi:hypothetical protein